MSISGAFNSALSGLNFVNRSANAISNNIANATTEGYGARSVHASASVVGGEVNGVRVGGVIRHANDVLIGQRQLADATLQDAQTRANFLLSVEASYGTPDQANSLSAFVDRFEQSLIGASNSPDSTPALNAVVNTAKDLAAKIGTVSGDIQTQRQQADAAIASEVEGLNTALENLYDLNRQILARKGTGGDAHGLLDQQQVLIDQVASAVPIRVLRADNGALRLYSRDGVALLDGPPAQFEFTRTPVITPDMTLAANSLSDITVNGNPVPQNGTERGMAGGRLGALFEVRDDLAVSAQAEIDALSRNLIERFEDPAVDATRLATDPGLFTDNGAMLNATDELGLSQRLAVNTLVDPAQGGDVARIRTGLGAVTTASAGDATTISNMIDVISAGSTVNSGLLAGASSSFPGLAASILTDMSTAAQAADRAAVFSAQNRTELKQAETEGGVNTDQEMQKLLLVEKLFTANARVIQASSDMLDTLMRIGS